MRIASKPCQSWRQRWPDWSAAGAVDRTVQVREAQLRATPSFLGKLTGACAYEPG